MTPLRRDVIDAMRVRSFSDRTQECYLAVLIQLAKYHRCSPDQLSVAQLQAYFLHLVKDRQLSGSSCRLHLHAMRFFYLQILRWERFDVVFHLPKKAQRIPELLTRDEVARIIQASETPKQQMLLQLCYGCGLRVSELVALKVRHIDAERRLLRIEQDLARYSHRTALTDSRLIEQDEATVGLRYTDYRDNQRKIMALNPEELIRRFLLHVLPKGLMPIRHYGFLANRCRAVKLERIRQALAQPADGEADSTTSEREAVQTPTIVTARCPRCRQRTWRLIGSIAPVKFDSS